MEEPEDVLEDDHLGSVEFDLLNGFNSWGITTTSEIVLPYSEFKISLRSVCSAFSFQVTSDDCSSSTPHRFSLISFSYKATPNSYVILAYMSKVACLWSGLVQFSLYDISIILHDVLHIPKLCSPLLSVQCFWRLKAVALLLITKVAFSPFHKSSLQLMTQLIVPLWVLRHSTDHTLW